MLEQLAAADQDIEQVPFAEVALVAPVSRARLLQRAAWLAGVFLKLVVAIALVTLARATIADEYEVPTGSMWPTIMPGDRIFVDKTAYGLRAPYSDRWIIDSGGPAPGDVVVFGDPRGGITPLVKRVVAVAGQMVAMRRGVLYVDGRVQPLESTGDRGLVEHLGGIAHAAGPLDFEDFGPARVADDHIFVMGDNRAASLDSRVMGSVPRKLVRGRVRGILYRYDGGHVSRLLHALD
jgi:signal peptidase I